MPDTRGRLCEGTGSNVVVVIDGEALTPTLETGCLPGITRALALEWCDIEERDLPIEALEAATEIALMSSTRDIQPVHRVDAHAVAAPGPVIGPMAEAFRRRAAVDVDP